MQANDFYRGVLYQIKVAQSTGPSATPASTTPSPSPAPAPVKPNIAPAAPAPMPATTQPNSSPFGAIGNVLNNFNPSSLISNVNNTISDGVKKINTGLTDMGNSAIDKQVQGMGWKDLWNQFTGPPNPAIEAMFKARPELKQHAVEQMLSRAGQLSGEFLKNNWGKIAAIAGGSGIAIAMLKHIISNRQEQQQQQQLPQRATGPRFL